MTEFDIVRREIGSIFKMNGLEAKRDTLDCCVELLHKMEKKTRTKWMNKIVDSLRKTSLGSTVVAEDTVRDIFKQISSRGEKENASLLNIFDVFGTPRYIFDAQCKKMLLSTEEKMVAAHVGQATEARRQRFLLIQQRAERCKSLQDIKFSTVDSLLSSNKKCTVFVLGLLSQQKDDTYHVEDLTGSMQLEFTAETKFYSDLLFTEGSFMIFEGSCDAAILSVTGVALVPPESAKDTRTIFGNENWFGGEEKIAFRDNEALRAAEMKNNDAFFVIMSEVHLDSPIVLKAIYQVLSGYSSMKPTAFIFCGNFCSRSRQPDSMELLDAGFKRLAAQISEFKNEFLGTHFIFVPGPDDPSLNMILPRPNLPARFFSHLQSLPNCHFVSNPVRIQFASQEIVIIRQDLVEMMCRHSVNTSSAPIPQRFARSILSQAHLAPLPPHVLPVLWDYDYSLSLHPLPDLLVVADKFSEFRETIADTLVCNPGSFSNGSFSFQVYHPGPRDIDNCSVQP